MPEIDIAELEAEVCARITMFTVKDLVSKLKRDRAPGVDGVSSAMLIKGETFLKYVYCVMSWEGSLKLL